jgi:UDP-N-acetylglucosamine 2-epimerase (non-hydrolysing)
MTNKVLIVIGTRPEALKISLLVKKLRTISGMEIILCSTGQHKEILLDALSLFDLKPDISLDIMRHQQDLFDITAHALLGLRQVLADIKPQLLLVHGDTSSTLAGALAGFYLRIPVGHIEAGLRTKSIESPWPEEMNRRFVSQIATLHFAPTQRAANNLLMEKVSSSSIFVTGNTSVDTLIETLRTNHIIPEVQVPRYVVITSHRRELREERLKAVCSAIIRLSSSFPDISFKFVLHPSPDVSKAVISYLSKSSPNVILQKPLTYATFLKLVAGSCLIITDSGGLQEEAPYLGKPVIVLEDDTERMEAVDCGYSTLVGINQEKIYSEASQLLSDSRSLQPAFEIKPFGDGKACERIAQEIKRFFNR